MPVHITPKGPQQSYGRPGPRRVAHRFGKAAPAPATSRSGAVRVGDVGGGTVKSRNTSKNKENVAKG